MNPTQSVRPQDTPPIWMDKNLQLKGLINEISRKLPLFSPHHRPHTHSWNSSPFTEAQRTQPNPFDHRTYPVNGLKLAQLSNFLTHLLLDKCFFDHPNLFPFPHHSYGNHTPSKGQEATPIPLYSCSIQYLHMIAFLHVWGKRYVKVLSHGPNSKMYYTTLRSSSVLFNPVHTNSPLSSSSEQLRE